MQVLPVAAAPGDAEGADYASLLAADLARPAPPRALKPSNVIRVFVSSCFKDHYHTRRVLNEDVFPPLRQWCVDRGLELLTVDLQWGVPAGTNSLDACFGELAGCAQSNGAPFFLYLGGQRYGWAPNAAEVARSSAPACSSWVPGSSVTAMEVLEGGLRARNPRALYCLRAPEYLQRAPASEVPPGRAESDDFFERGGAGARQRALHAAIAEFAPPGSVLRFDPSASGDCAAGWRVFACAVQERLRALIAASPVEDAREVADAHARHARLLAGATMPRDGEADALLAALRGERGSGAPVFFAGPSGTGKTTLMAQAFQRAPEGRGARFAHFCGVSGSVADLARRVAGAVAAARGGAELPYLSNDNDAIDRCMGLLGEQDEDPSSAAAGAAKTVASKAAPVTLDVEAQAPGPLLLFIDAVNQLDRDHLAWLPLGRLSADVRIAITCTPAELERIREGLRVKPVWRRKDKAEEQLHAATAAPTVLLAAPDPSAMLKFLLKHQGKALQPEHAAILLPTGRCTFLPPRTSPLWLKLVVDVLLQDGTFEALGDARGLVGGRRGLLLQLAEEEVPALTARLFDRAEARAEAAQAQPGARPRSSRVGLLAALCVYSVSELSEGTARGLFCKAEALAGSSAEGVLYDAEWSALRTCLGFLWQPFAGSHGALKVAHTQLEDAVRSHCSLGTKLAALEALKARAGGDAKRLYVEQCSLLDNCTWVDMESVAPGLVTLLSTWKGYRSQLPRIYAAVSSGTLAHAQGLVDVASSHEVHTASRALLAGLRKGKVPLSLEADVQISLFCSEYLGALDAWTFASVSAVLWYLIRSIAVAARHSGLRACLSIPVLAACILLEFSRWLCRAVCVLLAYVAYRVLRVLRHLRPLAAAAFNSIPLPCAYAGMCLLLPLGCWVFFFTCVVVGPLYMVHGNIQGSADGMLVYTVHCLLRGGENGRLAFARIGGSLALAPDIT
jgi:hypothetical protein